MIILTDLFGGTPSNRAISLMKTGDIEVIAGVNLPMLIRLEGECIKALTSIKRGIDMLDERHQVPRPPTDGTGALSVESEATEPAPTP